MRRGWQLACVILLGVFAAALLISLDYSLSDSLGPGAGFFPFWLSLIGGTLTIAILVQSRRNPDLADTDLAACVRSGRDAAGGQRARRTRARRRSCSSPSASASPCCSSSRAS